MLQQRVSEWDWMLSTTFNYSPVIFNYMWRHIAVQADWIRSGSQRQIYFVGFFNMPVLTPTRGQALFGYYEETPIFCRLLGGAWLYGGPILVLDPNGP